MPQAEFNPLIARMYSSTECDNSTLTIQATTAGLKLDAICLVISQNKTSLHPSA